ncbi:hypothetical protein C2G38_2229096 [Gigaspora rosea]|uniref:Uncharacterized protein n=1 Tax=Gigaspora rosea TaxID=44941 RepID=A0A397TZT1_9GLOM|nr:hypothetical protein C2G38_2229096 [Gigaspora rosea]
MFFISIFIAIRVKTSKIHQSDSYLESIYHILNKYIHLKLISLECESSASTNEEESKDIKNIKVEESESTVNEYMPYGSIVIDYREIEPIHSSEKAKSITAYLLYSFEQPECVKEFCHSYMLIDIWNAPINEEESNDIEKSPNYDTPICSIIINNHEIEQIYYSSKESKLSTNYLLYSSETTGWR